MQAITYSQAQSNWVEIMDRVVEDHDRFVITRDDAPPVVLMSLEDYDSWNETIYLLRSPRNAQRLLDSIAELEAGGGQARELIE